MNNTRQPEVNGARLRKSLVLCAALAVSACSLQMPAVSEQFGDAVQANQLAQVVDPVAATRDAPLQSIDGKRAVRATTNLREAKTEAKSQRLVIDLAD